MDGKVLSMKPVKEEANKNINSLLCNIYPGRGLIVGLSEDAQHLVQTYWIMGRSEGSHNQIFVAKGGDLMTALIDTGKAKDASLTIYLAMTEKNGLFVVSSGGQADTVIHGDSEGVSFEHSLSRCVYEPDAPDFTPRITAILLKRFKNPTAEISVLKKSRFGQGCDRLFYKYDSFCPGFGFCVTTYVGDGNPLPSFCGEPFLLPMPGTIKDVADNTWDALDKMNRVSLAVKFISLKEGDNASEIFIINKYSAVV